jgi:molybdenum cofactor biosynthesis enzyme MoaA
MKNTNSQAHPNNPCNGFYGKCLDVKITNECNGNCSFCIERGGYRPESSSVDLLIAVTNDLKDYQKVLILGGEPFMYPYLLEYLEGIKEKQEIYITTNGTLFPKWPLEKIAKHLTAINISIHHYSQAGNASILGAHFDFIDVFNAIKIFKEAGVKVRINTNLVKGGMDDETDIKMMISAAKNLGAHEIRFAELQHAAKLYIPAQPIMRELFPDLPEEPFASGCEHAREHEGIKVLVRLACGFVNPKRQIPQHPVCHGSLTKVLYPNGLILNGWQRASNPQNSRHSPYCVDCHGINCHGKR